MNFQDFFDRKLKAFKDMDVFVISKDGKRIADIALKTSASGGTVTAHVEIHSETGRNIHEIGTAKGFGYDKHDAAIKDACMKIKKHSVVISAGFAAFEFMCDAANPTDHREWKSQAEHNGCDVWQIV